MLRRIILASLLVCFMPSPSVAAERFELSVTVTGVPTNVLKATVHYSLHGGADGHLSNFFTLTQRDRHGHFQFHFRDLSFPGNGREGFVWGNIYGEEDTILLRVPVTHFNQSLINDARGRLNLSIRARERGNVAFRESFPIFMADRGMFTDESVSFLLNVFRTLVQEEFVESYDDWRRVYEKFLVNIDYFAEGNSQKIGKILLFLEDRYRSDRNRRDRQTHFATFYASFLTEILLRDIGGRPAPSHGTLADYSVRSLRTVIEGDPEVALQHVRRAMEGMLVRRDWRTCLRIGGAALLALNGRESYWESLRADLSSDWDAKMLLKNTVDCLQLHYVLESNDLTSSMGALTDGARYARATSDLEPELLLSFTRAYEALERLGRFPIRDRHNQWRQVYEYYLGLSNPTAGT